MEPRMNRREFLSVSASAVVATRGFTSLGSPDTSPGSPQEQPKATDVVLTDEALAIHRDALLIDGHNDLPWELRTADGPSFRNIDLSKPQPKFHTDIARLRQGNVGAQFWSAYVPASTGRKGTAVRTTLEHLDV